MVRAILLVAAIAGAAIGAAPVAGAVPYSCDVVNDSESFPALRDQEPDPDEQSDLSEEASECLANAEADYEASVLALASTNRDAVGACWDQWDSKNQTQEFQNCLAEARAEYDTGLTEARNQKEADENICYSMPPDQPIYCPECADIADEPGVPAEGWPDET